MADAIRTNREEESHRVSGFSLMEPAQRLGSYRKRLWSFLHDVRVEMKHVNWPSRADVISTTAVVVVTVAFFAVFFGLTDTILTRLANWVFHLASH